MAWKVKIENEQIETMKNWPAPTSVRDIQVFIGFANFYQRFIQSFSKIATLLISLLKTIGSSDELAPKTFSTDNDDVVGVDGKANGIVINLYKKR